MHQLEQLLLHSRQTMQINLEYQNIRDLTLSMKLLQKFPNLKILSLHGNHLTYLPNMSQLKLTTLDISNNPLEIDNYLLDSLFSLQYLENLCIDGTQSDLQRILENLPNLKMLNKKKVIREKKIDKRSDFTLRMQESLVKQKQKIKEMATRILDKFEYHDTDLDKVFDENFKQIYQEYLNFSSNVTIDNAKEGVFIFSKNRLVDLLQEKLLNTLAENNLEHLADSLEEICILRKQYFDHLLKIVLQVGYNEVCLEDELGDEINSQMKNIKLRKQRLYLKEIMRLKKKVNDYRTYCNKIEEENSKYLQNLYSLTNVDYSHVERHEIKPSPRQTNESHPSKQNRQSVEKIPVLKGSQSRPNLTPSKSTQKLREQFPTPTKKGEREKEMRQSNNKVILGYDQTKSLMKEFLQSKQSHNEKAMKKKQPFETAEEHLSSFFVTKYGIKSIAINWSLNFIRSLQTYSREDTSCSVLLKIFKHTVEESFYQEHLNFIEDIKRKLYNSGPKISSNEAQRIFLNYFPTEDLDQFRIVTNFSEQSIQVIEHQLCKIHIKYHEKLLAQFVNLFRRYDTDGNGSLSFYQTKEFVTQFFKSKIEKGLVPHGIVEKVIRKFEPSKRNKIIFSQLVEVIDKIS